MQLGVKLEGDFKQMMVDKGLADEKAATKAIRRASTGLKNEVRGQIKSAGLGQRFANTIRSKIYPERRDSINAAGWIYASAKSSKDRFYTNVFEEGATIRAGSGKWLAMPINVGYVGSKRVGINDLKRLNLEFRPTNRPGVALLVQRIKGKPDQPVFLLLKQVRIRKRIDAMGASQRWFDRIPDLLAEEMEKGSR